MNPESIAIDHPFLKGLSPEHLKILAENALPAQFQAGEVIFRTGEMANRFYLLTEGRALLERHRRDQPAELVQEIGAGDVLGWSWLFPPYYWRLDARAAEATCGFFFYGTRLREYAEQNHDFGYELMKRVANVAIHRLQRGRLLDAE